MAYLVDVAERQNQYAVVDADDAQLMDDCTNHGATATPLYTTPPQRQPLTDEEIDALELPESGTGTIRDLVRVVEKARGIGGDK